jgi:histone-lysine N-methyltransferase SETMAR
MNVSQRKVPDRESHTIQSPKYMVTVVWNPSSFHVMKLLPNGSMFDIFYYTTEILQDIVICQQAQPEQTGLRLVIHSDDECPHTATVTLQSIKSNEMLRAHHSPYSLDLTPSDFCLFKYIKDRLKGETIETVDENLFGMSDVLKTIEKVTLESICQVWIQRLEACISTNGEHIG